MPLCVSDVPLSVILTFLMILPKSLSRPLSARSKVSSSGIQTSIWTVSSAVQISISSPRSSALQPLGSSNWRPASGLVRTRSSRAGAGGSGAGCILLMLLMNCPPSLTWSSKAPGSANVKTITTFLASSTSTPHSTALPSNSPVPPVLKCRMPLCVSDVPRSVVLIFLMVLPNSLSSSLSVRSKVSSSGTKKTICTLSSPVETYVASPSRFVFQPLGS